MITSGTSATVTTSDTAVDLLTNAGGAILRFINIINGSVAGFYSLDGGTTWARIAASANITLDLRHVPRAYTIKVKRIASGNDLADVFASAW